ncbi:MAG: peptidoglycan editing factor PgeF [Alphaproteobacteria bacterium]|nr:peptidoglycan editing factor PgeF [Alphaproteobacteria bacterium]
MTHVLRDSNLAGAEGIVHGFFTRDGGVSEGLFSSLNVGFGSGDDEDRVAENRARAAAALGLAADRLTTAYQVHSARVDVIDAPFRPADAPRADGFVTAAPGVLIGILTADCAPVLFADPRARVIGAAHAGWRGALGGVLEATVRAMEGLGAARADIRTAIGPCIGAASYEVGPEFPAPFLDDDPGSRRFFGASARAGHFMFDLEGYVAHRLDAMGLAAVGRSRRDTCREDDVFFSYRRATLNGEPDYGRGLSAIALAS